jgi:hypothetical protein
LFHKLLVLLSAYTNNRRNICWLVLAATSIYIILFIFIETWIQLCVRNSTNNNDTKKEQHFNISHAQKSAKRLINIAWYKNLHWLPNSFDFNQCEFKNCGLTSGLENMTNNDAIIFHYRLLGSEVPPKPEGQIWILWNTESPVNDKPLSKKWSKMFDWSATYRSDSEIVNQRLTKLTEKPSNKNYSNIFSKKRKFAAWVVSNCETQSNRHLYVKELQRYVQVDVFGKCGSNKTFCEKKSMAECHLSFSDDYKFYLGFENSICRDYITEKLFHGFLDNNNVIYVYRGAPNVDNLVPKNTFVNTKHYDSPKMLGGYLKQLGTNKTEYISILKEKDKYILLENKVKRTFCSMCKLLNTYKNTNISWTGRNFNSWFRNGVCNSPTDLSFPT